MALDVYDQAKLYLNGELLVENTSIKTGLVGDDQVVNTTVKGFAGISPSPKMRTIEGDNVVTVTKGMAIKAEKAFLESTEVEFKIQLGGTGQKVITKGFFGPVSLSTGVGQTSTMSFSFNGTPSAFA